jgi:hypothetical protein
MTKSEIWRQALRVAIKCENANAVEISTAMEAIGKRSPIVEVRVARALSKAMAYGGMDRLSEDEKQLLIETVEDLNNPAGRLPTGDTPAGGHIHLRVTMERKNRYVRAARKRKMKLSEWMTETCDNARSEPRRTTDL